MLIACVGGDFAPTKTNENSVRQSVPIEPSSRRELQTGYLRGRPDVRRFRLSKRITVHRRI
jgi:hypothetical protein